MMRFIKTVLSCLLSIVLAISLFSVLLIINISNFFKIEEMEKTVEKIDIVYEMNKIKNSSATSESKAEIAEIINSAYDEAEKHNISTDLVDTIFNSTEVKQFLGRIVGTTTDNIINGKSIEPVTSADFNELLDDNIDRWIKESGVDISDSKKEVLVIRMKSAASGVIDNLPSSKTLSESVNAEYLDMVRLLFSLKVKIGLIVVSLICLVLLILLKFRNGVWLLYGGSSILISGALLIAISLVMFDMITYILNGYNVSFMISAFSNTLSHNVMITGIVSVTLSIIMYIIYLVRKKVNQ